MYQKQQTDAISTGLKRGWLFGLIMLGIYILYIAIDRITGFPTRFLLIRNADINVIQYGIPSALLLIAAIVFLIGGITASARTGLASSGWIAGNFGGLVYGIGSLLVYGIVLFGVILPSLGIPATDTDLYWTEVKIDITNQLVMIVLVGGFLIGNLAGAIGGLIGRGSGRRRLAFPGN